MSNHDKDNNLDEYLTGNSELSSLYHDSEKINPGKNLDNSILAAAKREVESKPKSIKNNYSPFSNNYFIPLSTAATVIIVIAVVSFFPEQQELDLVSESVTLETNDDKSKLTGGLGYTVAEQEEVIAPKAKRKVVELKANTSLDRQRMVAAKRSKTKKENVNEKSGLLNKTQVKQRNDITTNTTDKFANNSGKSDSIKEQIVFADEARSEPTLIQPATVVASAPMASILLKDELIYDEANWKNLSSDEWLKRITEIYRQRGEQDTKEMIILFNKKFPNLKLTIQDIISGDNNH